MADIPVGEFPALDEKVLLQDHLYVLQILCPVFQ